MVHTIQATAIYVGSAVISLGAIGAIAWSLSKLWGF